jgi:hypothetical protein
MSQRRLSATPPRSFTALLLIARPLSGIPDAVLEGRPAVVYRKYVERVSQTGGH